MVLATRPNNGSSRPLPDSLLVDAHAWYCMLCAMYHLKHSVLTYRVHSWAHLLRAVYHRQHSAASDVFSSVLLRLTRRTPEEESWRCTCLLHFLWD